MSYTAISDDLVTQMWEDYLTAGRPRASVEEDALARHYLPYATQVGERFRSRVGDAVDRDEILQNGYLGLMEAIRTYDPEKASFQTYANRKIQWKIQDALRGGDWLPRRRRDNVKTVQQAIALLQQHHGANPTDEEIARVCNLTVDEVRVAYEDQFASKVSSLNDMLTTAEGGKSLEGTERLPDQMNMPADEDAVQGVLHGHVYEAIRLLPLREKQVVALYFFGGHTQEEIGRVFNIGYSRVSQILKGSVARMYATIEGVPD